MDNGEIDDFGKTRRTSSSQHPASEQISHAVEVQTASATWTIPIQISVSIPNAQAVSQPTNPPTDRIAGTEGRFSSSPPAAESGDFTISSVRTRGFSWQTTLSIALASKLAYETPASIQQTVSKWGFSECRVIDVDDTQCFLASSDDFILLAFRGTENLGDWLTNLNLLGTTRDYGKVHRGFLGAFEVVRSKLALLLDDLGSRQLLLTGHSLGGALATIAAAEWIEQFSISGIYTFGQPGVGKKGFFDFMDKNYGSAFHRFVNDDDIVPRVPPTYRHVGQLFHFDAWGSLKNGTGLTTETSANESIVRDVETMSEVEFEQLQLRLQIQNANSNNANIEMPDTPLVEGFLPSVSDHGMDKYIEKIRRMI